jgi:anti-anti-sigma factor
MREHRNGNGPAANGSTRPHQSTCLTLTVTEPGATLRLRLTGEFDLSGVGAVETALDRMDDAAAPVRVLFDLRDLRFLDVSGLRTILRTAARGRAEAFEVVVIRPRGTANRVFTLTRAGEELTMVDDMETV